MLNQDKDEAQKQEEKEAQNEKGKARIKSQKNLILRFLVTLCRTNLKMQVHPKRIKTTLDLVSRKKQKASPSLKLVSL